MSKVKNNHVNQEVAEEACAYARAIIKEGTSQLINNTYTRQKKSAIARVIHEIRALAREYDLFDLEIDGDFRHIYKELKYIKKFSIGNCTELTHFSS